MRGLVAIIRLCDNGMITAATRGQRLRGVAATRGQTDAHAHKAKHHTKSTRDEPVPILGRSRPESAL